MHDVLKALIWVKDNLPKNVKDSRRSVEWINKQIARIKLETELGR